MSAQQHNAIFGLNLHEVVFFGILLYLLFIATLIFIHRCILKNLFCPFSGSVLHCIRMCCNTCPDCKLLQGTRSVFCCRRRHSVYDFFIFPKYRLDCFLPSCQRIRCFCCELTFEEKSDVPVELNVINELANKA